MKTLARRLVGIMGAGGLLLVLPIAASAQGRANYLNNLMATAQMMQPGFGGGFNPQGFNPGPAFANPYAAGFGGALSNPYTAGGFGSNPYATGGGGGYGGMPYGYGTVIPPAGYFLMGTADIMKAYGTVVTADQQARILSEQAKQMHIQTLKMRFEYEMFVKANTIPYSEVQAKIFKDTVRRIRTTPSETEIWNGKSLNVLLNDLQGARGKKILADPPMLSQDVLKHLNVTKKYGNLGLLRNDGRFQWPAALQEILPPMEREAVELTTQGLVQKAIDGNVPGNGLTELKNAIQKFGDELFAKWKADKIDTDQYRTAKRFLESLDSARLALQEPGTAAEYFKFQTFATGGKSIQDVVDYMLDRGLKFAPSIDGDESAYRALHTALATYDVAYANQLAAAQVANTKE